LECHTKDPQHKKEWELKHRSERLARRRELRQTQSEVTATTPETTLPSLDGFGVLLPAAAGFGLAAYQPKLAVGAGGITLLISAIFKKSAAWWIIGAIVLAFGVLFLWIDPQLKESSEPA
jgi:hypothetical protein